MACRERRGVIEVRGSDMTAGDWMRANLATQGYDLTDQDSRALWLGLRFAGILCMTLVIAGLALGSPAVIFALSAVGLAASTGAYHPFDHLWNHGVRRVAGGPPVPPTAPGRRFGFRVATGWLLAVGTLLAAGASTAGTVAGTLLLAACAPFTLLNLCIPSVARMWWERRAHRAIRHGGSQA
jgi:hypothetical protein